MYYIFCFFFFLLSVFVYFFFFFFFQAEDGIRDKLVTGVQTCALPISGRPGCRGRWPVPPSWPGSPGSPHPTSGRYSRRCHRSEEHTSELQSLAYLVCRLLLEKKKKNITINHIIDNLMYYTLVVRSHVL